MFYYLFSHKHVQDSRLRVGAERRPTGWETRRQPASGLTFDTDSKELYSLQQQDVDSGFSGCLFWAPDFHLCFTVMVFSPVYCLRGITSGCL